MQEASPGDTGASGSAKAGPSVKAAPARRLVLSDSENALSSDHGRGASPERPHEAGQQQEWDKVQTPPPLKDVGPPSHLWLEL